MSISKVKKNISFLYHDIHNADRQFAVLIWNFIECIKVLKKLSKLLLSQTYGNQKRRLLFWSYMAILFNNCLRKFKKVNRSQAIELQQMLEVFRFCQITKQLDL